MYPAEYAITKYVALFVSDCPLRVVLVKITAKPDGYVTVDVIVFNPRLKLSVVPVISEYVGVEYIAWKER